MSESHRIRALVLDIDGVLTDGRVEVTENDLERKSLFYRDVDAVYKSRRDGLQVALLTGESSALVDVIARRLAVEVVVAGAKDKQRGLDEICDRLGLQAENVCYVGDADRDAPALASVGLGLAPADASRAAKLAAQKVLTSQGGRGAVSEALLLVNELNSEGPPGERQPTHSASTIPDKAHLQAEIARVLQDGARVKQMAAEDLADALGTAAEWIMETIRTSHKLLLFGNGGSAADAQHMAAEFVGGYGRRDRPAWPAIALTTDSSVVTAISNDYGFESVFARQVQALGVPGDLVLAFTTSGNSPNVVQGVESARERGLRTIGLTGEDGGRIAPLCDLALRVPSSTTARIQECHIAICHALCDVVEGALVQEGHN